MDSIKYCYHRCYFNYHHQHRHHHHHRHHYHQNYVIIAITIVVITTTTVIVVAIVLIIAVIVIAIVDIIIIIIIIIVIIIIVIIIINVISCSSSGSGSSSSSSSNLLVWKQNFVPGSELFQQHPLCSHAVWLPFTIPQPRLFLFRLISQEPKYEETMYETVAYICFNKLEPMSSNRRVGSHFYSNTLTQPGGEQGN